MDSDRILVSRTHNRAVSLFTDEEMRSFSETGSTRIFKTLRDFEYMLGPMGSMLIQCEKCVFVCRRYGERAVVLGFDAATPVIPLVNSTGWLAKVLATEDLERLVARINETALRSRRLMEASNSH